MRVFTWKWRQGSIVALDDRTKVDGIKLEVFMHGKRIMYLGQIGYGNNKAGEDRPYVNIYDRGGRFAASVWFEAGAIRGFVSDVILEQLAGVNDAGNS